MFRTRFRRKRPALFKSGQWQFHQDNAPIHNSILVTEYLSMMGIKTVPQPPYSQDLAPCDFCLFPKLRGCLYERIVTADVQRNRNSIRNIQKPFLFPWIRFLYLEMKKKKKKNKSWNFHISTHAEINDQFIFKFSQYFKLKSLLLSSNCHFYTWKWNKNIKLIKYETLSCFSICRKNLRSIDLEISPCRLWMWIHYLPHCKLGCDPAKPPPVIWKLYQII